MLLGTYATRGAIKGPAEAHDSGYAVYVMTTFYALPPDDKENVIETCWFYAYEVPDGNPHNRDDLLLIFDVDSDEQIGTYRPQTGLQIEREGGGR